MFDVVVNFSGLFKNCCSNEAHRYDTSKDILKETIEATKDHDVIVSMVLLKIVNNSFSAGLLYKYSPHLELVRTTSRFDYTTAMDYSLLSILIVIDDKLAYTLNLISKKKVKYSKRLKTWSKFLKRYI